MTLPKYKFAHACRAPAVCKNMILTRESREKFPKIPQSSPKTLLEREKWERSDHFASGNKSITDKCGINKKKSLETYELDNRR